MSRDAGPVIVVGVAGAGKTTLARALAGALGRPFLDADDFHSRDAKASMARGEALSDADRAPWLARLHAALVREPACVLACSALKQAYRDALAAELSPSAQFVFLHADRALIGARIAGRGDHFFPPTLIDSQFDALEPPLDALWLDARAPLDEQVATTLAWLDAPSGVV